MPILGATAEESDKWVSASDGDIPGAWKDLARLARKTTGKVASRVAARRAGISHDTIIRLWDGDRISVQKLIDFAKGYGVDPKPLLEAADYPIFEVGTSLGPRPRTPSSLQEPLRTMGAMTVEDLERIPFVDDAQEVAHLYSGIADPRMRERIKELIRTAVEVTDREPPDAGPSGNGTD